MDAAIRAARFSTVRTEVSTLKIGVGLLPRPVRRFGERSPGNGSGAMYAEYQVPEAVPDVPATGPDTLPGIPADPTAPGADPEPMGIAARFSRRGTLRTLSRLSILVLALFLALAPAYVMAQTTGGGGGGGTTSGSTTGGGTSGGTTSGTTTGSSTTTTTSTDPNAANGNVNYTWIVIGAVVLIVVVGLVVMSNRSSSSTSTTVRRD